MVDPLNAGSTDRTSDLAEEFLVVVAMVVPILVFLVVIGPSRVVVLSLFAYGMTVGLALAITHLLDGRLRMGEEDG